MFWTNQYGFEHGWHVTRTTCLGDILLDPLSKTILTINGWDIRVLISSELLPSMQNITLVHLKGVNKPWRGYVFQESHLALAHIFQIKAARKLPIILPFPLKVEKSNATPWAWVIEA